MMYTRTRSKVSKPSRLGRVSHLQRRSLTQSAPDLEEEQWSRTNRLSSNLKLSPMSHSFSEMAVESNAAQIIQPKLDVNSPEDESEEEADRVSAQVMRMPNTSGDLPFIRRQSTTNLLEDETEEEDHTAGQVMRSPNPSSQSSSNPSVSPSLEARITGLQQRGQSLAHSERAFFEPRFGHNFVHVKIHNDRESAKIARSLNARAFTVGQNIVFGEEQYQPRSTEGQRLLAHELTHVVQQNFGQNHRVSQKQHIQRAPAKPSKRIEVDLSSQNLYAFRGSKQEYSFNCVSGDSSHPTPTGHFHILRKHKTYTSKKYGVPMNYAMFFTKTGEAIHQSQVVGPSSYLRSWGLDFLGSHGCVRLSEDNAATLFEWTPLNTPVWVH